MILESEISECSEYEVKLKIGNIFVNEKILEEYFAKIYEIDPYLYKDYKKIQVDENGCEYILFRTYVYFFECLLAVEIDEKGHTDRDFTFEEKRQKTLEKNLGCKFIRINTGKRYDEDYKIGRIQTFVSKFRNRKVRKLEKENQKIRKSNKRIKELEDEVKN